MPPLSGAQAPRGAPSSEDGIRPCLERVEEREAEVRAWEFLDPELALAEARRRDAEQPRSPLHGMAVGVKDIIATADMPTGYGSPIYAGHRPASDAECVGRLRSAGVCVLGKTATTEFATYHASKTRNPHDPSRTPGGSSSGSAAAVAAGMVPIALGTQTAGSIIRPASFCGVFGFKPSYGTVPREGVFMLSDRLDTIGAFARDADGLALVTEAMADARAGIDFTPREPAAAPRIGLYRSEHWHEADPDGRRALEAAAERLAAAGAELQDVALSGSFGELAGAQETIMGVDAARALAGEYEHQRDQLSPELIDLLEQGRAAGEEAYRAALELAERCARELDGELADLDALITPAAKGQAPVGLEATGDPLFCRAWTLLGVPAVSVPGMTGDDGMPIGVQLIGRTRGDGALLGTAAWVARGLR